MGFAAGFQVGASAVERGLKMREEDALKRNLAQEAGRYNVTEGAYGPGLQENIQQLQGLREQDPAQAAAYDQAIGELTRRQGLAAPDYSVASGAQNYGTRQEARQAAAPMRTEGLAGVYRQAGMIDKADELEARAFDQQRGIAREARDVAREGREVKGFETQQAAAEQLRELTGIKLGGAKRDEANAQKMVDFNAWQAQNPQAGFAEINAEVKRLGMGVDQQFKIASNLTGIGEQEFKASQQRIKKLTENQGLDGLLKAHKESNDLDPGSHFEVIRGKGGTVSLNRVDTATGKVIQPNVFTGNEAETTAYLNKAAMDPATIIDYTMNLAKGKADIAAKEASATKDKAMAGLYAQGGAGAGKGGLKQKVADFKEVYGRDPTEEEKGVLAGLTNKPREFTAADVNARAKLLVEGGMMDPDDPTKPIAPQKALQMAQAELSGTPYISAVDKLIADMAKARQLQTNTQPAPIAAPTTPAASAPVGLSLGQQPPSAAATARDARFEQNAQAGLVMREREQRAASDPDIRALRVQLANMRSGDPRKTAELTKEILALRQGRYGF